MKTAGPLGVAFAVTPWELVADASTPAIAPPAVAGESTVEMVAVSVRVNGTTYRRHASMADDLVPTTADVPKLEDLLG